MEQKFLKCKKCGNIVPVVKNNGCDIMCCGEAMQEIIPGEVDAAKEKHVPQYEIEGNKVTVTVGEVLHPMQEEHFIEWISIQTKSGNQRKGLKPGNLPNIFHNYIKYGYLFQLFFHLGTVLFCKYYISFKKSSKTYNISLMFD